MMSQDCIAHPSLEQRFLSQHHFALIGFSTTGRKFGNYIYRKLSAKGLRILPVNPAGTVVDGIQTYRDLRELPVTPQGVIIAVKSASIEKAIHQAIEAGINRVWIIGSGYTRDIEKLCADHGIEIIHNRCILMYFGGFPHNLHYMAHRLWRRLPRIRPGCAFYDDVGEWRSFTSPFDGTEQQFWLGLPQTPPPEAPRLAAMYLHQQNSDWSGVLTSGMYEFCRSHNMVCVSTDYRGPDSHLDAAALADINHVIELLIRDNGVSQWIAAGVSMGAIAAVQLAFLLPENLRPSGVVAVLPVYDLPAFFKDSEEQYQQALLRSYGGTPDDRPGEYHRRSPHCNVKNINPDIPFAVFTGSKDDIAPISKHGQRLAEALKANGNPHHYIELDVGHDPEVFSEVFEEGLRFVVDKMGISERGNSFTYRRR